MATIPPPSCAVSVDPKWNNTLEPALIVENRGPLLPGAGSPGVIVTDADVILWNEVVSDADREKLIEATNMGSPACTVSRQEMIDLNILVRIYTVTPKPTTPAAPLNENLVYYNQTSGAWLHIIDDSAATP